MPTRTQIFKEIMREYDVIRTEKAGDLRRRKEALYMQIPRLEEIERELALLGTKTARMMLQVGADPVKVMENLRAEQKTLEEERLQILKAQKLTKDYLQLQYVCDACADTGFIETERCACLKRKLMDKLYDQSNVRHIIQAENFEHFDLRLYNNTPVEGEDLTPYENIQKIYRRCLDFVETFGTGENLLLYGNTGLGKTFCCNSIAKDLLDRGNTVLYLTAGQLFRKLEEQRFHRSDDEEEAKEWDQELLEADLLIIDDLGTEFSNIFTATELFRIINDRILARKSMIISTNLSIQKLMDLYSDRVTSRLLGEFSLLRFYGQDIRIKKKFQR